MIGLHKYFVNNLVFMGSNTDPAVDGRLDVARAEIGAAPDKKSMMARVRARLKLVGLATVLAAAPVYAQKSGTNNKPTPAVASTDGGQVKPTLVIDTIDGKAVVDTEEFSLDMQQQAINLALEAVPEAGPYIDDNGDFSLKKAVLEGGMDPVDAAGLQADWAEAYSAASRKVLKA
ncbi:MAG: hypothetical protein COA91_08775 [Robiginitomaculum sp.]|nr:MAG: hypothetical protein COA91_08775 [Robiginitomaculum sp.]